MADELPRSTTVSVAGTVLRGDWMTNVVFARRRHDYSANCRPASDEIARRAPNPLHHLVHVAFVGRLTNLMLLKYIFFIFI